MATAIMVACLAVATAGCDLAARQVMEGAVEQALLPPGTFSVDPGPFHTRSGLSLVVPEGSKAISLGALSEDAADTEFVEVPDPDGEWVAYFITYRSATTSTSLELFEPIASDEGSHVVVYAAIPTTGSVTPSAFVETRLDGFPRGRMVVSASAEPKAGLRGRALVQAAWAELQVSGARLP